MKIKRKMANIKVPFKLFTMKKTETLSIRVSSELKTASERLLAHYNRRSLQELIMDVYEQWLIEELTEDEIRAIMAAAKSNEIPSRKKSKKK